MGGPRSGQQIFDRQEAARLRTEGLSYAEIGHRFGVSKNAVYLALNPGADRPRRCPLCGADRGCSPLCERCLISGGETLGQRVRARRTLLGLTQAQLAERAGVSANTIGQMENGQYARGPTAETLSKLLDALGMKDLHEADKLCPKQADRFKLLHGPYRPPALRPGDRVHCLLRSADVVITGWSDARISWPRCRVLESRGGSGILLDAELARAVRCESAAAVAYWWNVTEGVVWRWRRALGVTRTSNEGSRRLIQAAAEAGGQATREHQFTEEERIERRERAKQLDLKRFLQPGYHGPRWTAEELALLGTMSDADLAQQTGRSVEAVRCQRTRRGIPGA